MEERNKVLKEIRRIVITGPECTGKSTLVVQLASHYNTDFVSEYARDYVANLGRPYTYEDVVHIAEVQVQQAKKNYQSKNNLLFLDTYLIITKGWFEVVYGHYPEWIDHELELNKVDLYL